MPLVLGRPRPAERVRAVPQSRLTTASQFFDDVDQSPDSFSQPPKFPRSSSSRKVPSYQSLRPRSLNSVRELAIEVTILTTLDRARVLFLANQHGRAVECLTRALQYAKFSSNPDLKYKCVDRIVRYHKDKYVTEQSTPMHVPRSTEHEAATKIPLRPRANSDVELKDLSPSFQLWVFDRWAKSDHERVVAGGPPPTAALPPLTEVIEGIRTAITKSDLKISFRDDDENDEIKKLVKRVMDEPSRRRRAVTQLNPAFVDGENNKQHSRSMAGEPHVIAALPPENATFKDDLSLPKANSLKSIGLLKPLGEVSGSLLSRRRRLRHNVASQAHPPPPSPSQERLHPSPIDSNATTINLMPVRRPSLDSNDHPRDAEDDVNPPLSVDTPSLTKLVETLNVNSSPQSNSSSSTTITAIRRLSQSVTRAAPQLSVKTTELTFNTTIAAIDHTIPVHHSPLRETFVPDADDNDTAQPVSHTAIDFADLAASDRIPRARASKHTAEGPRKVTGTSPRSVNTDTKAISELRAPTPDTPHTNATVNADADHDDLNETITDADRLEAQHVIQKVFEEFREVVTSARSTRSFLRSPRQNENNLQRDTSDRSFSASASASPSKNGVFDTPRAISRGLDNDVLGVEIAESPVQHETTRPAGQRSEQHTPRDDERRNADADTDVDTDEDEESDDLYGSA